MGCIFSRSRLYIYLSERKNELIDTFRGVAEIPDDKENPHDGHTSDPIGNSDDHDSTATNETLMSRHNLNINPEHRGFGTTDDTTDEADNPSTGNTLTLHITYAISQPPVEANEYGTPRIRIRQRGGMYETGFIHIRTHPRIRPSALVSVAFVGWSVM